MAQELIMGNEAIALGALKAGVHFVSGYPGTPSTEILETIAKHNKDNNVYVEWSVNEKVALEVAAGAAYSGARALVTMKQVGLNVASDPLMSLAYVGVKGGLVIVSADDPGPISSQTEQDTRTFAAFSKLPVFDPSSPEEAYEMIQEAFELSEKYQTPVLFRPTTRVCHGCASMDIPEIIKPKEPEGFIKDTKRWVIFPHSSYLNHIKIENRNNNILPKELSVSPYNKIEAFTTNDCYCDKTATASNNDCYCDKTATTSNNDCYCDKTATTINKSAMLYPTKKGIVTGGISYQYTKEALQLLSVNSENSTEKEIAPPTILKITTSDSNSKIDEVSILKIGTPFPFPEDLSLAFLQSVDEVIAIEELDPVLEQALILICGKHKLPVTIKGKLTGHVQNAGENTVESVKKVLEEFLVLGENSKKNEDSLLAEKNSKKNEDSLLAEKNSQTTRTAQTNCCENSAPSDENTPPELPVRPPVLCAGCPHRASFYAVKRAMKGVKSVFCGDIGCYTLGNAMPLDMTDTCLCMGADITIAQGMYHISPDTACFSFIGDSTFFAAGLPGVVNAVYNQAKITIIVLDNSNTAMTGNQPHPGTGVTMMGEVVNKVNIEKVLEGIGVGCIEKADPLNLKEAIAAVKKARFYTENNGVSAVIFKSPCIAVAAKLGFPPMEKLTVNTEKCIGCKKCINELGCPALIISNKKVAIEQSLCTGCGLCSQVCPVIAISAGGNV